MTLTKADLIDSLYNHIGLSQTTSTRVVASLLEIIKATLERGEDILISGFGKFSVKEKNEWRGRNPHSREDVMLDARRVVTFRCSGGLRDTINGKG
jgi:integration host factor subunit alpha